MDSRHIRTLLAAIAVLLLLNLLASFKPYQVVTANGIGYRVNVYTGGLAYVDARGYSHLNERPSWPGEQQK